MKYLPIFCSSITIFPMVKSPLFERFYSSKECSVFFAINKNKQEDIQ